MKQALALGWILVFLAIPAHADTAPSSTDRSRVVAIDPGHGGKDNGASGPTGLLEKTVVLELARQLALALETNYHVTLTRSDDYYVEPRQRTAIANNANADLMLSLHTGAGYRHTNQGQAIYYHATADGDTETDNDNRDTSAQRPWRVTQVRHAQTSHIFAQILKQQLEKSPTHVSTQIQGAPLVVLQGADLPAVLIEIGHITNPNTEKALTTPQYIAELVKAISNSIHQFMDQHARSSSP